MSWVSCEVDCLLSNICSVSCFIASCEQGTVLSLNVATAANPTEIRLSLQSYLGPSRRQFSEKPQEAVPGAYGCARALTPSDP